MLGNKTDKSLHNELTCQQKDGESLFVHDGIIIKLLNKKIKGLL